ncbi:hypothetical protein COA01_23210 [Bacillus cereus]|uniref:hypothetical protein n=1 Tax=Bacillus cereus TaxID=1396 RepID=UPI000BFBD45F|nr:hypothetical protein [Bacillus cereus]PGP18654.1 hypothetical protein COA01_23210 [Bacillus cereus]
MDTIWNPELERKARLEAFCDGIVHYLRTGGFEFNETELRQKLDHITDEEILMILQKKAVRTDTIENFLKQLNKK